MWCTHRPPAKLCVSPSLFSVLSPPSASAQPMARLRSAEKGRVKAPAGAAKSRGKLTDWLLAARPKTLGAAVVPFLVGRCALRRGPAHLSLDSALTGGNLQQCTRPPHWGGGLAPCPARFSGAPPHSGGHKPGE